MAIWCFQVYPDHLDIVDYYEGHGQGFKQPTVNDSRRVAITAPTGCPYDARRCAKLERLERARGSRRFSRRAARASWLQSSRLMDGINAARKTIPFARFDKARRAQGLEACYPTAPSGMRRRGRSRETPEHNWASHGADA